MLEQLCPSAGPTFVFAVCRMYWAGAGSMLSSTEQAPAQCFLSAGAGHLCGIGAASAQRRRRWPALYRCCTDVLSLLGYDVITFNEHNKNYAYFYFIIYAYFNLINFIMYRQFFRAHLNVVSA